MLYAQLKHPVTLATLLFLLLAGVAIRWNEYTLPRYARHVDQIAATLSEVPPRTNLAGAENAAPLYEEAHRLLKTFEQEKPDENHLLNDFREWYLRSNDPSERNTIVGRLPLPKDLRDSLEAHLEIHRDVLALLHRAANIPSVSWTVPRSHDASPYGSWPWSYAISNLLLLDTMLHMDDHDEAGALRAVTTMDAFIHAQEQIDPPIAMGRRMLFLWWPWELVLNNGFETGLFSDAALDILDDLLAYEENPGKRVIRGHWSETQFWASLQGPIVLATWNISSGRKTGSLWYQARFSSRNSMKEVLLYELLLNALPRAIADSEYTEPWETIGLVVDSNFFTSDYGFSFDPYSSDPYFSGINCDVEGLFNRFRSECYYFQMGLTLRTVLALARYQRQNGQFPTCLEDLAPAYLSPEFLRMTREFIEYEPKQMGWEITSVPRIWDTYRYRPSNVLYRYPLPTP